MWTYFLPSDAVGFVSLLKVQKKIWKKNVIKKINLETCCSNSSVKSDTLSSNICAFCSAGVGFAVIFGNFFVCFCFPTTI